MAGAWVAGAAMAEGGSELVGIGALWVVAAAAAAAAAWDCEGGCGPACFPLLDCAACSAKAWDIGTCGDAMRMRPTVPLWLPPRASAAWGKAGMVRVAAAAARQRWRRVSIGHVRFPACPRFINGGTEEFRRSHIRDDLRP